MEIERKKAIAPGIFRNQLIKICSDERPHIEADQIEQTEAGAIGHANQRASERVHFFDGEIVFQHRLADSSAQKTADSIGDEIGRVLGAHHALAQAAIGELLDVGQDARVRLGPGNQLHQVQVARRVEKVCAQEMAAEVGRESRGDFGQRDAAGIGGKDGAGFTRGIHLAPEHALGVQVFDDSFDNPVAFGELVEIVLEITGLDQRGFLVGKEPAWALFQGVLNALQRGSVALGLTGES